MVYWLPDSLYVWPQRVALADGEEAVVLLLLGETMLVESCNADAKPMAARLNTFDAFMVTAVLSVTCGRLVSGGYFAWQYVRTTFGAAVANGNKRYIPRGRAHVDAVAPLHRHAILTGEETSRHPRKGGGGSTGISQETLLS